MPTTNIIVVVCRFLFELLAILLVILGSIGIFFGSRWAGFSFMSMWVSVASYLMFLVVLLGALAMQMDNNRLLREIAESLRHGSPSDSPKKSLTSPMRREPKLKA